MGADDDGVFGSVSVAGWSCDDGKKSVTLDCVNGASSSSFIMCSSKGGYSNPRLRKGVDKKRRDYIIQSVLKNE